MLYKYETFLMLLVCFHVVLIASYLTLQILLTVLLIEIIAYYILCVVV